MGDQARRRPDEAQRQGRRPATSDQRGGHGAGKAQPSALSPATLMYLQRTAGNATTAGLVAGAAAVSGGTARSGDPTAQRTVVQRQKTPPAKGSGKRSPGPPLKTKPPSRGAGKTGLGGRLTAVEKRQMATAQDLEWRAKFGYQLSSWRRTILRISGALEAAQAGFREAHVAQQAFEAIVTQLFMAAASIGIAFGFEPFFEHALGKAGVELSRAERLIERWENPVNQTVGTGANVYGSWPKGPPETPSTNDVPSGSPLGHLTSNLETLEGHVQAIEQAFGTRAAAIRKLTDEQAAAYDVAAQETVYVGLLKRLNAAARGVDSLKEPQALAVVFERHLWAAWLRTTFEHWDRWELGDLGGYIEDRLNQIGVSKLAGVELSGHWYSSNSSGYRPKLLAWAKGYNETISKK